MKLLVRIFVGAVSWLRRSKTIMGTLMMVLLANVAIAGLSDDLFESAANGELKAVVDT